MNEKEIKERKEKLITYLQGIIDGLKHYSWDLNGAYGNMLIHLEGGGYLTLDKQYYVKRVVKRVVR